MFTTFPRKKITIYILPPELTLPCYTFLIIQKRWENKNNETKRSKTKWNKTKNKNNENNNTKLN